MSVGIVLAAHVAELAAGTARLARQMAPDVTIVPAGGTDEGAQVGTSFDRIEEAVIRAESGDGVLVLYDLGSAQLTAEMVADVVPGVRLQDAPLVEGAVAAAVSAAAGATLDQVAEAAASSGPAEPAGPASAEPSSSPEPSSSASTTSPASTTSAARTVTLPNPLGLHARPAAALARVAGEYDADLLLGRPGESGIPATRVIGVTAAGIRGSEQLRIAATGPQSEQAVAAAADLAASGFGEATEPSEPAQPSEASKPVQPEQPAQPSGLAEARQPGEPAQPTEASKPAQPAGSAQPSELAQPSEPAEPAALPGVAASPGVAVGPVVRLQRGTPALPHRKDADPETEHDRVTAAIRATDADLAVREAGGGTAGEIAGAHRALLADPELLEAVRPRLDRGAERAWWEAATEAADLLGAQGRAMDLEDLALAVLSHLGVSVRLLDRQERLAGGILVAPDMLPSQVSVADEAGVAGLALAGSARTAHAAIIARGLGLPTVLRLGDRIQEVPEGREVVLDADDGTVRTRPTRAERTEAVERAERQRTVRRAAREAAAAPVPGVRVMANVGGVAEARAAVANGADGVGLLRTEFLFLNRPELPDEEEQVAELTEILAAMQHRPVTIRTLDVGGDKMLPALSLDAVRHGPLGERGLRYGLRHEALMRTQLRAILRAAASHRVSVMAPMVTAAEEARAFVAMVTEEASGLGVGVPPVGVMVEVPAAALDSGPICAEVDFVSVGTNDLAQYLLAADRTLDLGPWVGRWNHPAVFTAVETLVNAARQANCPVAVCGELAGDSEAAPRLVGLGVDELSMAPSVIPTIKARLRAG